MKIGDLVCVRTLPSYVGLVIAVIDYWPVRSVALDGEPHTKMRVYFAETNDKVEWEANELKVVNESR